MAMRVAVFLCLLVGSGCAGMSKLDYSRIYARDGWQRPARVVEALGLEPGQRVADLGAGDGYFTFRLAEAVGPEGLVYAVEVDEEKLAVLEAAVRERAATNVRVVHGRFEDPQLPDGEVDLVVIVNTYHHIAERVPYFTNLRRDLARGGRVANIDVRDDLTGILSLFPTEGHWTPVAELAHEMEAAGYLRRERFDFLPLQSFEVYAPAQRAGSLD